MHADRVPREIVRLAVTGGGTGGHVVPALNILSAARQEFHAEVLYIGSPGNMEERLAREYGYPFSGIRTSGLMGKGMARKMKAMSLVMPGVSEAIRILKDFSPDLLVGTGGYVQVPPVIAASLLGIPVFLLEPNVLTGWANRLLKPLVAGVVPPYGGGKLTGVPLGIDPRPLSPSAQRFSGSLPVLVAGGSQGARQINRQVPLILEAALKGADLPVTIFHQAGESGKEETEELYRSLGLSATVVGFVPDLPARYQDSALVIARAGAMTVAEITYSGTPAFYVPYPLAIRDHQRVNAEAVRNAGGGWVWDDASLTETQERARELFHILSDPVRLHQAAVAAWTLSPGRSSGQWLRSLLDQGTNGGKIDQPVSK